MGEKSERQLYLLQGRRQLHSFVLEPERSLPSRPAVVLVHPLFYERTFACRNFYRLARVLRARGILVVMFDFEEYGSSRGPLEEPTLEGHLEQSEAALSLARDLGAEKIGLFGVRSGGLLAYLLASKRQDLSALALWAPLHRPNSFARELRVKERLRRLQLKKGDEEPREIRDDEPFDVNGYLATPRLLEGVERIDLRRLEPPRCPVFLAGFKVGTRKVPEVPVYAAVLAAASGSVTVDETSEDRPWVFTERADPVIPAGLLERTSHWIADTLQQAPVPVHVHPLPTTKRALELPEGTDAKGRPLTGERVVMTEFRGHALHGVVHEPLSTAPRRRRGFLFLDTSNRLMVEMARALAAQGFPILRADIGASSMSFGEECELQPPLDILWDQAAHLVDFAQTELGVDHVGLSGLCFFAMLSTRVAILREKVVDRLLLVGMPFHAEGLAEALRRGRATFHPPPAPTFGERVRRDALIKIAAAREIFGEKLRLAQDSPNPWVRIPSQKLQDAWTNNLRPWFEGVLAHSSYAAGVSQNGEHGEDQVAVRQSLLAYRGRSIHLLTSGAPETDTILGVIRTLQDKGYRPTVAALPGNASNSFNGIAEREAMVAEVVRWTLQLEGNDSDSR